MFRNVEVFAFSTAIQKFSYLGSKLSEFVPKYLIGFELRYLQKWLLFIYCHTKIQHLGSKLSEFIRNDYCSEMGHFFILYN